MSNDKRDQPTAGHNPNREHDRGEEDQTPGKGQLHVRQADGTAMLTQTDKTFGKGKGHKR